MEGLTPAEPLIELDGVSKWFGAFQVLRGVHLRVAEGERIVICGPSGSGKSTLIRCINRLEEHQEGRVVFAGRELGPDTADLTEVRREIGMVFQEFNLFPHLTVLENCMLGPTKARGMSKAEARDRLQGIMFRELWEAIQEDRDPESSGREGRAAMEMMHAAWESHRRRARVDLPMTVRENPLDVWAADAAQGEA